MQSQPPPLGASCAARHAHSSRPRARRDFAPRLPWELPLEEWESDRIVEIVRGVGRHVVRFVRHEGALYALKELPERLAAREYHLLRALAEKKVPAVEPIATVSERSGQLDGILVTRYLDFSLPYRMLFSGTHVLDLRESLLDALVELLVRLHLEGFFWGDCSLSNTLFRRDAGALSAHVVDAENAELHPALSDGQRRHDLAIAEENIAGELEDIREAGALPDDLDPPETARIVLDRYHELWSELTREQHVEVGERHLIAQRLERLHELGYNTDELELVAVGPGTFRLHLNPRVVEPGYHSNRLLSLTDLQVGERQARRLLDDMLGFREELEREGGSVPEPVLAFRWLTDVYQRALDAIPEGLREKLAWAEIYHQLLEHRWYLSEELGRCASVDEAIESYVDRYLSSVPDERVLEPPA